MSLRMAVLALATHAVGARVVDALLSDYPKEETRALRSELYGKDVTLLLGTSAGKGYNIQGVTVRFRYNVKGVRVRFGVSGRVTLRRNGCVFRAPPYSCS